MNKKNEIIFQDENFIAVNKEPGICVFCSKDDFDDKNNLKNIIEQSVNQELFIVSSLDKDSSGIVIFAKNENSAELLRELFRDGKVLRKYIVLLSGTLENDEEIIEKKVLISRDEIQIMPYGQRVAVKYKVMEKFRGYTLIEAYPLTQIKRQIRLLFWSIGNPLAIDKEYSSGEPIFLSSFKRNYKMKEGVKEKPIISRLTLHCSEIEFEIPKLSDKKKYSLKAQMPKDFEITIKQMRKYYR
ncbi:MAG: hypothetical protein LBQ37_02280 [Elusimicrobiota bacterium]|jgi:23S rRNA-/tRNA-specific pseudouridylate synthase|nr:hypothetical protein [Elusimicrobiota bacterium]